MACMMRKSKIKNLLQIWGVLVLLKVSGWSGTLGVPSGAGVLAQTYMLSDGDSVTCIRIEDQPSLRDQATPHYNKLPTTSITSSSETEFPYNNAEIALQTFSREVGACPEGTIPVTTKNGGEGSNVGHSKHRAPPQDSSDDTAPHEYAFGTANAPSPSIYKGTEVVMSIWDPYVEYSEEFSLAQLWLTAGQGSTLSTVEVGYQVIQQLGGDLLPRLFIFWTVDNYKQTGCYDLKCPGFVQVSNKVLIRGSFAPVSTVNGQLYEIKLRVFQDDVTHDWWLQLNDEFVGYWPRAIYINGLQTYAEVLQWGGEIVDDEAKDGNRHTMTDMGNGNAGSGSGGAAAYMRNLKYVDSNNELVAAPFYVFNTSAPCYSVAEGDSAQNPNADWGSYFFYGGPGYNSQCLTDPNLSRN